jgi:hypothetical protein
MVLFGGGAVAWWLAAKPVTSTIPVWPAYVFAVIAAIGFYGVLAPLLRWWPWIRESETTSARSEQRTSARVRVMPTSKLRVPRHTARTLEVSEDEAARIAASRDPRFAQYREMPKVEARSTQEMRLEAARRAARSTPQEREMDNLRQQVQALSEEGDQQPVPDAHRDELKELAAAYSQTIGYHRAASGKQNERHERSFCTHFPDAGKALEACDKTLAQRESARAKMRDWLQREDPARGRQLVAHVEAGSELSWHVDAGCLFMDGGQGIAQITDETDVEAIKRPYAELLTRARATPEAGLLRATVGGHDAAVEVALDELRRIQMLHVIRGKCELC